MFGEVATFGADVILARHRVAICFLLGLLLVSSLLLLVFFLLPTGIRVVCLHSLGEYRGLLTEILPVHDSMRIVSC